MIAIIDQVSTGKGRIRTLPSSYSFIQRPSWSPDGSQIVYQHAKDPRTEATLLVTNADGTGERLVKHTKGFSGPPNWTAR